MSIFSRVCDSKAEDPFNCALFKCYKFMKGRTGSMLPRTKYVKCFRVETIAVVTLQTFYLGKHYLLTVYLGKLDFLSVTNFSLGNLPRGNFIVWVLDMSRKQ